MDWQYTSYMIPLIISSLIALGTSFYAYRRRETPGALLLALLMLSIAEWSLAYVFRMGYSDLAGKLFWARVRYIGIVVVPGLWLAFALTYTGLAHLLTPRNLILLAIEPVAMLALVWTNGELHQLVWKEISLQSVGGFTGWNAGHGPGYTLHSIYSYVLLGGGIFLLLRAALRTCRLYRIQAILLLTGSLFPLLVNVFGSSSLNPLPHLDFTPFAFTISGVVLALALFRGRLLQITPVLYETVVNGMCDGIILLDEEGYVVDINPAAREIIGVGSQEALARLLVDIWPAYEEITLLEGYDEIPQDFVFPQDVAVPHNGEPAYYDLRITALMNPRNQQVGRMLLFHDITKRRLAEVALRAQKSLLENLTQVARLTAETPALPETLQKVLDATVSITGAEGGNLLLLKDGAVTHSLLAMGKRAYPQMQPSIGNVMQKGLAGWVVRTQESAIVKDTLTDERWTPVPGLVNVRSALAVPIIHFSHVLGVLTLTHSQPGYFSADHHQLLMASADQMALALHNAQIFDIQHKLADRMRTLYEVLRSVTGNLNPKTVPHVVVNQIAQLTGWPAVAILIPNETHDELVVQAATSVAFVAHGWHLPLTESVAGRALRTGESQYVLNFSETSQYTPSDATICSEIAVPLSLGGRVLGVLDVQSNCSELLEPDDVQLAELLADSISLSLDSARHNAEIGRYLSDLSAMYEVARAISRSLKLEAVLSETLDSALSTLGFDAGWVALANVITGDLELAAQMRISTALSSQLRSRGFEGSLSAAAHSLGRPVLLADVERERVDLAGWELDHRQVTEDLRLIEMRACVCVPLLHQDRSLGVLTLFARRPLSSSSHDLALQASIGRQIATAVVNARLFQAVEDERGRLQAVIESSRDGIIFVGLDMRILVMNSQALYFLKLAGTPDDWVNLSMSCLVTQLRGEFPDVARLIVRELRKASKDQSVSRRGEFVIGNRALQWLHLPVVVGSAALGRLIVYRDVTEERLLERMREDLTHSMVHDLRNPLTGIYGAIKLLDRILTADVLTPSHRQIFDLMQSSTERMLSMVNAILDISKLESGQMPIVQKAVALPDLAQKVLDLQLSLAADKDLHLELEVDPDLPPVWVDLELVQRVLQNLVGNAIKFTPENGVVRINAHRDLDNPGKIRVQVIDTGEGVPSEIQGRLFQKFVAGQQIGRGSGLGLAFCRMVLEAHKERIWLEDTSEEGTSFCFTLPIVSEGNAPEMMGA